ncbi:hypothetical protein AVEN_28135-1 [Araneus ventricosus]|uniref:Reverse transcriptase domain-containing protein n=1 Tax=Araneus ventricosus TaxID=182803 RepID=A0A4Y2GDN5_ARAVE|nr:hypothetical protein AVEN_28135-1 [Araneus ventricosus]
MYTGCTTEILSNESCTDPIPISSGVKQGCPLSGFLFNMAIDPALRRLQKDSSRHKILRRRPGPASVTLHIGGRTPVGARDTSFSIGGVPLTLLSKFDRHRFLGKPVGFGVLPDYALRVVTLRGNKPIESGLAPWQITEALKNITTRLSNFPCARLSLGSPTGTKPTAPFGQGSRPTLSLPANEFLYGSRSLGCWGVPLAPEEFDLNVIDAAFQLLTKASLLLLSASSNVLHVTAFVRNPLAICLAT